MAKAPEATAGLCLSYYVMTVAKYTLHDHHFVVMAFKQALTTALTTTQEVLALVFVVVSAFVSDCLDAMTTKRRSCKVYLARVMA